MLAEQMFLFTEPPPQTPNLLILVALFINYIIYNAKYVAHTVIIIVKTLDAGTSSISKISTVSHSQWLQSMTTHTTIPTRSGEFTVACPLRKS